MSGPGRPPGGAVAAGRDDWIAPGAHLVAPEVYRIPLPLPSDGLRAVNVYAIVESDSLVLVDSGWNVPEAATLLEASLAELGAGLGDIDRFLVTHIHRDHYTLAVETRRRTGVPIALGRGERPSLEAVNGPGWRGLDPQIGQLRRAGADAVLAELATLSGARPSAEDRRIWEAPDEWLEPGPIELRSGRTLRAVETPGHTRGHLVFVDADAGLLFAGDHVLPAITPSIGFEPAPPANPLGDFLASLAAVRALPDATLLPAHGPEAPSVHARIDQLLEHHGRRLEEVEGVVGDGPATAAAVAARLRWTRRGRAFDELDVFNRMLAVCETVAHLELLVAQGRLARGDDGGVWQYHPGH